MDYVLFCLFAVAGFVALNLWMRRRSKGGMGLPIATWLALATLLGGGALAVQRVEQQTVAKLERAIVGMAPTYAAEIEHLDHHAIGLATSPQDPTYLGIIDAEKRWLRLNPAINDIYTLRPGSDGNFALIADSETDYDHNGRFEGDRESRTAIGEPLHLDSAFARNALAGRGGLDTVPTTDRWGSWISGYWPLHDPQGRVEAILGVDFSALQWIAEVRAARRAAIAMVAITLLMLFAGSALFVLQKIELAARHAAAEAMRSARDAAQSANTLKSQFLACMSHEIRTPMNGVMGMTELLLATDLDDRQRHFGQLIFRSAANLLGVINDILDYSKIEADKLVLEDVNFDPREVAEDVGELLSGSARAKGLELTLQLPVGSETLLCGDAARLRQVLTNLVGNAVKFTAQGQVSVSMSWEAAGAQRCRLRCEVRDTGPGMDAATLGRLFRPFVQADSSITRRFGGTGLGLAISKRLIELMGGQIGCESQPGQGTKFWFSVPLSLPAAGTASQPAPTDGSDLRGLRGFIVDDNDTNREILEQLLTAWGVEFGSASSAESALEKLDAAAQSGKPFDFAILDRDMPGSTGLDLARAIKQHPALASMTLLMLSSVSDSAADKEWTACGIGLYLTKPVRHATLLRELCRLMQLDTNRRLTQGGSDALETDLRFTGRLLLAEDNEINQMIAEEMLTSMGFDVDVVSDGCAAVQAVRDATAPYVAVLMDCEMPQLDGRSATRQIREFEAAPPGRPRLPVIALTAHAADSDKDSCIEAGMDDYLSKPMSGRQLAAILMRYCPPRVAAPDSLAL